MSGRLLKNSALVEALLRDRRARATLSRGRASGGARDDESATRRHTWRRAAAHGFWHADAAAARPPDGERSDAL